MVVKENPITGIHCPDGNGKDNDQISTLQYSAFKLKPAMLFHIKQTLVYRLVLFVYLFWSKLYYTENTKLIGVFAIK